MAVRTTDGSVCPVPAVSARHNCRRSSASTGHRAEGTGQERARRADPERGHGPKCFAKAQATLKESVGEGGRKYKHDGKYQARIMT